MWRSSNASSSKSSGVGSGKSGGGDGGLLSNSDSGFRSSAKNLDFLETAYKDAQMEAKLAAEISRALLEKNEQNERIIADLREMDEAKSEKIEQLELQSLEYAAKIAELQAQLESANAVNEGLRKNLVSAKLELKEFHQKQLDITNLKKENEKLLQQMELITIEMEQSRQQESALQKKLSKYGEEREHLQGKLHKLEERNFKLEEDLREAILKSKKQEGLQAELEEVTQSLETKDQLIKSLREEKEKLEAALNTSQDENKPSEPSENGEVPTVAKAVELPENDKKEKQERDEAEMSKLRQTIAELQAALQDAANVNSLHQMQQDMLKKEIRTLDKLTKREQHLNYEYLRHVVIEFLASTNPQQQTTLANVITTLLEFTPIEFERVRNSNKKLGIGPPQQNAGILSKMFGKQ